jgi:hypothetical protein
MREPGNGIDPADIEAVVRTYLARVSRRYIPLFSALVVLVLLATLVPSRSPVSTVPGAQGQATGNTLPETSVGGSAGNAATGTGNVGAPGGDISSGPGAPITPPAKAGARGIARSGVSCGPGVRQVTWTPYAPLCTPRYTGNNGGTRYRGVTKDKIIAFYRHARSAQDSAINAALGEANLDDDKYIADLKTYIGFFNKQFELYGRQVELVVYDGQADYLNEDQGIEQSGNTQADAQRAVDLNGFVDATFPLKGSYPFWQALADRKALTLGPTGFPQKWYEERSPYWYSSLPTGTGVANWISNMVCRRMVNMNASFAGFAGYRAVKRVFGLVHPENPEYTEIGNLIESNIKKCGVSLTNKRIRYTFNVAMMGNQSTSVVAQLHAQQVSTVICFCDPVFPLFLTRSANGQDYHPEWWSPGWGDAQAQSLPDSAEDGGDQWTHAVVIGGKYPAKKDDLAYKVFKMIKPNAEPSGPYYAVAFGVMVLLFDALQAAGPDLRPETFQKGWFSLGTINGPAGVLEWKPGHFSPIVSAPMASWNPNATSNFNRKEGAYETCFNGKFLPFDLSRASEWGSGQVACNFK